MGNNGAAVSKRLEERTAYVQSLLAESCLCDPSKDSQTRASTMHS